MSQSTGKLPVALQQRRNAPGKRAAFLQVLDSHTGFWGDGRLMAFALAVARILGIRVARQHRVAPEMLDADAAAVDAVADLYLKAGTIRGNARRWLVAHIRRILVLRARNILRRTRQVSDGVRKLKRLVRASNLRPAFKALLEQISADPKLLHQLTGKAAIRTAPYSRLEVNQLLRFVKQR